MPRELSQLSQVTPEALRALADSMGPLDTVEVGVYETDQLATLVQHGAQPKRRAHR